MELGDPSLVLGMTFIIRILGEETAIRTNLRITMKILYANRRFSPKTNTTTCHPEAKPLALTYGLFF
jgi:hypothetical protein